MSDHGSEHLNFYFQNETAFLSDENTVVYSVYAANIPETATFYQISDHFSEYGEIVDLKLKRNHDKSSVVAFIKFSKPRAAAKALHNKEHFIKHQPIIVKACERWFQLEDDDDDDELVEEAAPAGTSKNIHLNDDVLEEICMRMLPRNQLNFAMVSERFREIYLTCAKRQYKSVSTEFLNKMARRNVFNFIEIAGSVIKYFHGSLIDVEDDTFILMTHFVNNLEIVDLCYAYKNDGDIVQFLKKQTKLHTLCLEFSEILDETIFFISQMPLLTSLKLTFLNMTGEYLKNLTQLTDLSLLGCQLLIEAHFIEMIQCMKNLRLLDIRHCPSLTHFTYNIIPECLPNLKIFKFSCRSGRRYDAITLIPKLNYLEILDPGRDQTQLFIALANNKSDKLKSLAINFHDEDRLNELAEGYLHYICKLTALQELDIMCPPEIYNEFLTRIGKMPNLHVIRLQNCKFQTLDAIFELIKNCTNLKKLILNGCKEIRKSFIYSVIDVLKELQRPWPLLIGVWETSVRESILEKSKYISSLDNIKLTFDMMLPDHYGEFEIRSFTEKRFDISMTSFESDDSDSSGTSISSEEFLETPVCEANL